MTAKMSAGRVLVTPRSLTGRAVDQTRELDPLRAAGFEIVALGNGASPSEERILETLPSCVGWLAGVEPITRRVLERAPALRAISRNGTGVDNIDLSAAEDLGIAVVKAAGANAQGVAELTLAVSLDAIRGVTSSATSLREGRWERQAAREIGGMTIGVVGLGAIGGRVAGLFQAIGARVIGFDPFVDAPAVEQYDLADVLAGSDLVTLHVPSIGDGPLITREALSAFRHGATLVNTSRSALVDETAVLDALRSNQLAAYVVDAFDAEPPARTALLDHPRVLATPHLGGFTKESIRRAGMQAAENLVAALERG